MKWLRKFKGYVGATKAQDTNAIHCFYMLLNGPADDWFSSLADDNKDTLAHLYIAFEERYGQSKKAKDPNFLEQFEERRQKINEPVLDYIAAMKAMALGTDLEPHYLQSFIVKGLRPQLRRAVRQQNPDDLPTLEKVAKQVEDAGEEETETDQSSAINALVTELQKLRREQAEVKSLMADKVNNQEPVAAVSTPPAHPTVIQPQMPIWQHQWQQQNAVPRDMWSGPTAAGGGVAGQPWPGPWPAQCPPPAQYLPTPYPSQGCDMTPQPQWQYQQRHQPRQQPQQQQQQRQYQQPCIGCGGFGHPRSRCKANGQTCRICSKIGHFASVCRSSRDNNRERQQQQQQQQNTRPSTGNRA